MSARPLPTALAGLLLAGLLALAACAQAPKPVRDDARQAPRPGEPQLAGASLSQLAGNPELCFFALAKEGLPLERRQDMPIHGGCGMTGAGETEQLTLRYQPPVKATCGVLAALTLWEREVVEPAATRHLGQEIASIQQWGTFACRNRNHRIAGPRSEHARGNAIDIGGFALADGGKVSVQRDWGKKTPSGRFLAEVHRGACRYFNGVIGPDDGPPHHDHFHLDMGAWRFCD